MFSGQAVISSRLHHHVKSSATSTIRKIQQLNLSTQHKHQSQKWKINGHSHSLGYTSSGSSVSCVSGSGSGSGYVRNQSYLCRSMSSSSSDSHSHSFKNAIPISKNNHDHYYIHHYNTKFHNTNNNWNNMHLISRTFTTTKDNNDSNSNHDNAESTDGNDNNNNNNEDKIITKGISTNSNDEETTAITKNNKLRRNRKEEEKNRTASATAGLPIVDKEFSEYLTGKLDDDTSPFLQTTSINSPSTTTDSSFPLEDESSSSSSTESTASVSPTPTPTASTTTTDYFDILLHNEADVNRTTTTKELNDTYKNIELTQSINIENLRKKRLITVRRALGGNLIIATSKLAAFLHSGSSAMMSEFIHSVVDCGNQSLLLVGLRDSGNVADRSHPYGYGKSIYFWALVSALGTFFLGAGVSMTQALPNLIYGSDLHQITWHVWSVLGFSFVVDGYVFTRTLMEVKDTMPENTTLWKHVSRLRDPATLAILLEDGAACLGIAIAIGGLGLTQAFDMPVYDALAGVGISGLLASMGIILVRVNHRFLLGQSVDMDIRVGIEKILLNRKSIDAVHSVQSQWTGAETFSFKAEVDFDGTFLAAKLMPRYQQEFKEAKATLDQDLRVLLSWYAEDVMRTVEREVRNIEAEIRKEYPGAQYIELEPMSKDADRFAIDDGLEASLKRIEIESLNRYLKSLYDK